MIPSPMVGKSGDSFHSPSTKNLISYLKSKIKIVSMPHTLAYRKWKTKDCIPPRSKFEGSWKSGIVTSILWWHLLSLSPTIKGTHNMDTLIWRNQVKGIILYINWVNREIDQFKWINELKYAAYSFHPQYESGWDFWVLHFLFSVMSWLI